MFCPLKSSFYSSNVVLVFCRDAWNKLGRMPAEEAMLNYVDELKNVSICDLDVSIVLNLLRFPTQHSRRTSRKRLKRKTSDVYWARYLLRRVENWICDFSEEKGKFCT